MNSVVAPPLPPQQANAIRVMVVDDSAVIRGMVSRWIEAEPDLSVVASVRTGQDAVNQLLRANPDVVVLDIEMPDMDGITALPLLLAKKPELVVIMASTLTRRNAEISFKALALGASDYIPKPESTRDNSTVDLFKNELVTKIRSFVARKRRFGRREPAAPVAGPVPAAIREVPAGGRRPLQLRPFSTCVPRVLLIGSSTGGPQALLSTVAELGAVIDRAPVLITQHMPPMFTTILAEHLTRASRRPALEGVDGEVVKPGRIYLAPGKYHMRVERRGVETVIKLDDGPPVNFCKPAVDPLFDSAAQVWQAGCLGVVLTGMGADGMRGGRTIVAAGGSIIAQDEATSVVWGMPGAVAQDGLCSAILPLDQVGPRVSRLFAGDRA
ncbi:MAG TPA: chemotaxis response regulator protein-glutamate methylesterase [Xanthobacteraceae bacterium]|nr:chemotaxis response regulator protein-glutamate methylesterase [Xanthobacteraceae bacterium]